MSNTKALQFLRNVILCRLETELKGNRKEPPAFSITGSGKSELIRFIDKNALSSEEVVVLLLSLIPHIDPRFFSSVISAYLPNGGDFPEFGGVKGKNHRGILPTGETVLFVLAGNDIERRMEISRFFDEDHLFARKGILAIEPAGHGEPKMSGRLILD